MLSILPTGANDTKYISSYKYRNKSFKFSLIFKSNKIAIISKKVSQNVRNIDKTNFHFHLMNNICFITLTPGHFDHFLSLKNINLTILDKSW